MTFRSFIHLWIIFEHLIPLQSMYSFCLMVEKSYLKPWCSVACFSADKFVGMVLSYPVEADLEIAP